MAVEAIGIDHVFVAVRDLGASEEFYDRVVGVLGFRKREAPVGGDPRVLYYNRHFVYSLGPRERELPTTTRPRRGCAIAAFGR